MTPKELAFLSGYSEQNITKTLAFSSGYIQKQAQDDPLFSDTAVLATGAGAGLGSASLATKVQDLIIGARRAASPEYNEDLKVVDAALTDGLRYKEPLAILARKIKAIPHAFDMGLGLPKGSGATAITAAGLAPLLVAMKIVYDRNKNHNKLV